MMHMNVKFYFSRKSSWISQTLLTAPVMISALWDNLEALSFELMEYERDK